MTTSYLVFDGDEFDEYREVVAVAATRELADAIAQLQYSWVVEERPVIDSVDLVANVTVYESIGARMPTGLWSIEHSTRQVWKVKVDCGECDIKLQPTPVPGISRNPLVHVKGTDEAKVRAAFQTEALRIEAEFGHDKLRVKVEELDPMERF